MSTEFGCSCISDLRGAESTAVFTRAQKMPLPLLVTVTPQPRDTGSEASRALRALTRPGAVGLPTCRPGSQVPSTRGDWQVPDKCKETPH